MNIKNNIYKQDIKFAKELTNKHAKSFSMGIKLFPKDIRNATYAFYSFVRLPDDIVDEQNLTPEEANNKLKIWINNWNIAYYHDVNYCPSFRLMRNVMIKYNIPKSLIDDFFAAMLKDTKKFRYQSFQELQEYMHGSASVVGEIMAIICGANDKAKPQARALGEAFQLTNFLRDIKDDYIKRNRIYIPNNILIKYNCSHETIEKQTINDNFIETIKYIINYNRSLYNFARTGINQLNPKTQFGIYLASYIYEAILDKIEKENYNIYNKRIHTTKLDKIYITIKAIKSFKKYIKNLPKQNDNSIR